MTTPYHTRIAPSPTGDMHIGTARTAYFNWLAARASGGSFMLRIDDTDAARNRAECVEVIVETMRWLGLDYDRTVSQSSRFDTYREVADQLIAFGHAEMVQNGAVVLKRPKNPPTKWTDTIVGDVAITDDDLDRMDGMGLIKADGSPAYNFCTVVDDRDFGINFIIRGTDHITNTARQVVLFDLLGAELPRFAHVGLIGVDGKPMSKRDGAASMLRYRAEGYDPDAMLNFMARLGWGPKVDDKTTALLPKDRMLSLFLAGGKMKSSLSNYDAAKLDSFNRKYIALKNKTN